MHSDGQKLRSFLALLFAAGDLRRTQGKLIEKVELIRQIEKRLVETEKKLKVSEELAGRIRQEDEDAQRGEILKKRAI